MQTNSKPAIPPDVDESDVLWRVEAGLPLHQAIEAARQQKNYAARKEARKHRGMPAPSRALASARAGSRPAAQETHAEAAQSPTPQR